MSGAEFEIEPPAVAGDGVTDDTAAVQWYIDHPLPIPVSGPGPVAVFGTIDIPDGAIVEVTR